MAKRVRKCDKVLAKPAPAPKKEVCPICGRLPLKALNGKVIQRGCGFFPRIEALKFDDDKKKSDTIRSQRFRNFHATVCETCRRPLEECRASRLSRVRADLKKLLRGKRIDDAYQTPEQLKKLIDEKPCAVYSTYGFTPVVPDWYSE